MNEKKRIVGLTVKTMAFVAIGLILLTGLAGAFNNPLDVSFKAQVPPGTWSATKNCGQTSSLMVYSFYHGTTPTEQGIKDIDDWLFQKYGSSQAINGYNGANTNTAILETLAKEYGGFPNSYRTNGWTIAEVKQEIDAGHPVIVAVTGAPLGQGYGGHFLVAKGYTDTGIITNDPGRTNGVITYSNTQFSSAKDSQDGAVVVVLNAISLPIYVPDHYPTIQEAVDNAEEKDTIIVRDGIYVENVNINTNHLTIKSENGAGTTIVQAADSYDSVFEITADYVNVSGFTAMGATQGIGFRLHGDYCNILCNNALNNYDGIFLYCSNNNQIKENTVASNRFYGIFLLGSSYNGVLNNIAEDNARAGILINPESNYNNIKGNTARNNNCGIVLTSDDNIARLNIISPNNFISNIYHNAYSYDPTSIWNSQEKITYTYQGRTYTNYLGNHWDDYTGSDTNEDGIGDTPYGFPPQDIVDNYPLMEPFENYLPKELIIKVFCPVNLSVVDPDGLTINIETNEIIGASYTETDINQDGDPDDIITIPNRKIGNYEITVIPELNAEPEDTFTLQVSSDETLFFLAENTLISDISNNPYTVEANETGITDKTLINPEGGIGIAVLPRINHITSGSIINFTIKIVSTENFDDTFHVYLTNESLPASWRANIEWFNLTSTNISIPSGEEAEIQLRAEIPIEASGNKAFRVVAKSTRWTPVAYDTGILYIS